MKYPNEYMSDMRDGVIYARVSTDKQVQEGDGLNSQVKLCLGYAANHGINIKKTFKDEGVSGKTDKRPELELLYQYAKQYKDEGKSEPLIVLFYDISRLARHNFHYYSIKEKLEKLGCSVRNIKQEFEDTPNGRLMEAISVSFAAYDRENNNERTINMMRAKTAEGYWVYGSVPVGYKPGPIKGIKIPDPASQYAVKQALELFSQGQFKNYVEMAKFLNAQKILNHKCKRQNFDGERAKTIVRWAWFYAGFVELPSRDISRRKGLHEAIISVEVMENIERRLSGQKIASYRKNAKDFPLRGSVYCCLCGKLMTAAHCNGYPYYYCKTKDCTMKNKNIKRDAMHEQFEELLSLASPSQELIARSREMFSEIWAQEWRDLQQERHQWGVEVKGLDTQIQACVEQLTSSSHRSVKKAIEKHIRILSERQELLKAKIKEYQHARNDLEPVLNKVLDLLQNPKGIWNEADLQMRHTIQHLIFPDGLIYDAKDKNFRKPEKAPLFTLIEETAEEKPEMARPAGFEPATPGSGNQCSIP